VCLNITYLQIMVFLKTYRYPKLKYIYYLIKYHCIMDTSIILQHPHHINMYKHNYNNVCFNTKSIDEHNPFTYKIIKIIKIILFIIICCIVFVLDIIKTLIVISFINLIKYQYTLISYLLIADIVIKFFTAFLKILDYYDKYQKHN
jgi:hypothetical protein